MAITGDRYAGTYEAHTIELIRNNWNKMLTLLIDGQSVASASCALPHDITLTGDFDDKGARHTVVAKSVPHFPTSTVTIEVDGAAVPLTRTT